MDTKQQRIDLYVKAYEPVETLAATPKDLLDYRPFADAWTIRENILHLLDADLNGILRLKKAIAQPGTPIVTYDEEAWTANLGYGLFDVAPVIAVNKSLRAMTATLLRSKVDEDWNKLAFSHPDRGLVGIDQWLTIYIEHVAFHWELIERNTRLFAEKK